MSLLETLIISFGRQKANSQLEASAGVGAGVRVGGGLCGGFKERKEPGRWRGQGPGIKLIGVSAKSVTGFGDWKGRHILSSLLILI